MTFPQQPIVKLGEEPRFHGNSIVQRIAAMVDIDEVLAHKQYSDEERLQFAQLIGTSIEDYCLHIALPPGTAEEVKTAAWQATGWPSIRPERRTQDALQALREQLEHAEYRYLEQRGWKHTCQTPGSYWMWEKKLPDGRTAILHQDSALRFEAQLTCDECGKPHDECVCEITY